MLRVFSTTSILFSGFTTSFLDTVIYEDAVCPSIDGALEFAYGQGQGDAFQCSCNSIVNVFLFFPIGVTTEAACDSNAILNLDYLPGESNRIVIL